MRIMWVDPCGGVESTGDISRAAADPSSKRDTSTGVHRRSYIATGGVRRVPISGYEVTRCPSLGLPNSACTRRTGTEVTSLSEGVAETPIARAPGDRLRNVEKSLENCFGT